MRSDPIYEAHRVEAFSDGVFAIAITLIVLQLKLPELPPSAGDRELLQALEASAPTFLSYLVSFLVIGSVWMSHHRFFGALRGVSPRLMWMNLWLLLFVSCLPFPTAVLGAYGNLAVAEDLYAAALAAEGLTMTAMIWSAHRSGLLDVARLDVSLGRYLVRALVVPAVACVVVLVAVATPRMAPYVWLLIPILSVLIRRVAPHGWPSLRRVLGRRALRPR